MNLSDVDLDLQEGDIDREEEDLEWYGCILNQWNQYAFNASLKYFSSIDMQRRIRTLGDAWTVRGRRDAWTDVFERLLTFYKYLRNLLIIITPVSFFNLNFKNV